MISISLSDIIAAIKVTEDVTFSEVELLSTETDELVLKYAHIFGLDDRQGYGFIYNRHRNLQNKVVDGFRIVGEIRTDRDFINSVWCNTEDRAISHANKDFGFTKELFGMLGARVPYDTVKGDTDDSSTSESGYAEPDYDETNDKIIRFNNLVADIRGNAYNEYGKLKTYSEWKANNQKL
jgi:hypothetical protein